MADRHEISVTGQCRMTRKDLAFGLIVLTALTALTWALTDPRQAIRPDHTPDLRTATDIHLVAEKIDESFAQSWHVADLQPTSIAHDLTVLRRMALGLTGTLPSLEEIRRFEAWPKNQRIDRHIESLLRDRRFAEHAAERLARSFVGVEDGPFLVYRRRRFVTWLTDQLHANKPYQQIARDLIAGEGLWTNNPATNFVTVTVNDGNPDEIKLAARVSRAMLGVRLDCVQCHDDQLGDHWTQQHFHGLAAFFSNASMTLSGVRDKNHPYQFKFHRADAETLVPATVPFHPELLPAEGSTRDRLAHWATHPDNRAFARTAVNRFWALITGKPLVEPIDSIPLEGPFPPGLEILAEDFVTHDFDIRRLLRVIAATDVFQRDSRSDDDASPPTTAHELSWAAFPMTRLRPEQVAGAIIQGSSLSTLDAQSHILVRLMQFGQTNDFIKRYGDAGEDEFEDDGGTIPQRLILMNGKLVHERTHDNPFLNAAARIAMLAPSDERAIETAYLTLLTRRPSPEEQAHFMDRLKDQSQNQRQRTLEDLCWALINATEFAWNH